MDDSWDWVDDIIFKREEPEMELPEDILYCFLKKAPIIQELIDRFDCEIET